MLDVLQPFEVADSHSSSIAEDVGKEANSLFEEDLLSFTGCWAVGSLNDELAVESIGIVHVDRLLKGSRDEDIAGLLYCYH